MLVESPITPAGRTTRKIRKNRNHKNGARDARQNAGDPRHGDEEDLIRRIDGAGRDQSGGIGRQHGGIGAKVGKGVGSNRASPNDQGQGQNK